jgi:HAMP domain-containing protein
MSPRMSGFLTFLAYDREDLMVAALAALVVAGAIVAVGAWFLLFREVRRGGRLPADEQRAGRPVDEPFAPGPAADQRRAGEDRTYS